MPATDTEVEQSPQEGFGGFEVAAFDPVTNSGPGFPDVLSQDALASLSRHDPLAEPLRRILDRLQQSGDADIAITLEITLSNAHFDPEYLRWLEDRQVLAEAGDPHRLVFTGTMPEVINLLGSLRHQIEPAGTTSGEDAPLFEFAALTPSGGNIRETLSLPPPPVKTSGAAQGIDAPTVEPLPSMAQGPGFSFMARQHHHAAGPRPSLQDDERFLLSRIGKQTDEDAGDPSSDTSIPSPSGEDMPPPGVTSPGPPAPPDASPASTSSPKIIFAGMSPVVTFLENTVNTSAQILDASMTLQPTGNVDFNGGSLRITYEGIGLPEDQLGIESAGAIGLSGNQVRHNGITIGQITSDGSDGGDLVIAFGAQATLERVNALLEHLSYQNVSHDPSGAREIRLLLNADSGINATMTISVIVTGEADHLIGTAGPDTLMTGMENDTINGGAGNDLLEGRGGADLFVMDAASDSDTITDFGIDEGDRIDITAFGALDWATVSAVLTQNGPDLEIDLAALGGGAGDVLTLQNVILADIRPDHFKWAPTGSVTAGDDFIVTSNDGVLVAKSNGTDTLIGGDGDDTLTGGGESYSNDHLYGGAGNDLLISNDFGGRETMHGGAGDDTLQFLGWDGGGARLVYGGSGADTFYFAVGTAVSWQNRNPLIMDFEQGVDVFHLVGPYSGISQGSTEFHILNYSYNSTDNWTKVQANVNYGSGGSVFTFRIKGNHSLQDSDFIFDYLTGTDTITGTAGIDAILGSAGDNTIYAGDEGDVINPGTGANLVFAGDSRDGIITHDDGQTDTIYAEGGSDLIRAHGSDLIYAGDGDDYVYHTDTGADTIYGESHDDYINGSDESDYLDGGADDDTLVGHGGDDTLIGGEGEDTISGGSGADRFVFGPDAGRDTIADFWIGEGDQIDLTAFGALDWATVSAALTQNVVDLEMDLAALGGGVGDLLVLQNITLGNLRPDHFVWTPTGSVTGGDDFIVTSDDGVYVGSSSGTDTVIGGDGNDTLIAGGDSNTEDQLYGGNGNDSLSTNRASYSPDAMLSGGAGDDTILIDNSYSAVTLTGGTGADHFIFRYATEGNNVITDFTQGEDLIDLSTLPFLGIQAGPDDGAILGYTYDAVIDRTVVSSGLSWTSTGTNFVLYLSGNVDLMASDFVFASLSGSGIINLETAEKDGIVGSQGDDTITANDGDEVFGWDGDDSITLSSVTDGAYVNGGDGNDTLRGGNAYDYLRGGNGDDVIYTTNGGTVYGEGGNNTVYGSNVFDRVYSGSGDDLVVAGGGNDRLEGSWGDDTILGEEGNDSISGGGDHDLLNGGAGIDTISTGSGNDTVILDQSSSGNDDHITDFKSSGTDRIALSDAIFSFASGDGAKDGVGLTDDVDIFDAAGFAGGTFIGAPGPGDGATFLYDTDDGQLWYDADGNGAGAAVLIATIDNFATYTYDANDFIGWA